MDKKEIKQKSLAHLKLLRSTALKNCQRVLAQVAGVISNDQPACEQRLLTGSDNQGKPTMLDSSL